MVGTTFLFLGGMFWVFIDSSLFGPGYWLSTLGLLVVGTGILGTLYHGVLRGRALNAPPAASALRPTHA